MMEKSHKDPFSLFELEARRKPPTLRLLDIAQCQVKEFKIRACLEKRVSGLHEALEPFLARRDELSKVGFASPYVDHRMSACECPEEVSLLLTRRSSKTDNHATLVASF
jgi:hypothetical protein